MKLDLNNLTAAKFKRAEAAINECLYAAPCIIGTLMRASQRERLDEFTGDVEQLTACGKISFPTRQQEFDAARLQSAFDSRDIDPERYTQVKAEMEERYVRGS